MEVTNMETLQLIQMLYHSEVGIRRQAALIVGLVEETSALVALEQRVREEPDSNIKKVVMWAGNRVQRAHQRGYSTIDAIFEHFQINRELASGIDPAEAERLRHMPKFQSHSQSDDSVDDNLLTEYSSKDLLHMKSLLRLMPREPSNIDISVRITRLMDGSDMQRQKNTAIELREINNPQALPYLALVFYRKENLDINDYIEHTGKILYWNVNYAVLDKNGWLDLEIAKRRREGNYPKLNI